MLFTMVVNGRQRGTKVSHILKVCFAQQCAQMVS